MFEIKENRSRQRMAILKKWEERQSKYANYKENYFQVFIAMDEIKENGTRQQMMIKKMVFADSFKKCK